MRNYNVSRLEDNRREALAGHLGGGAADANANTQPAGSVSSKQEFLSKVSQAQFELEFLSNVICERTLRHHGAAVEVARCRLTGEKASNGRLTMHHNGRLLAIVRAGTLIVSDPTGRRRVCPSSSILFITAATELKVMFAKGTCEVDMISWPANVFPYLESWLEAMTRKPIVSTMGLSNNAMLSLARVDRVIEAKSRFAETDLCSLLYELVPRVTLSRGDVMLAPLPQDLPQLIKDLCKQVLMAPHESWPLKSAAEFVGYSPFHFSRVFKQLVGYGFHEFVDRCRTQTAVAMLCRGDEAAESIAAEAGFGSPHALRESLKEYLSILPTDIRPGRSD